MSMNPQLRDENSPLDALIISALRRFGEMEPHSVSGGLTLHMVELANDVLADVRSHPYWDGTAIEDYTHSSEARAVPDRIIVSGLVAYYAQQQASKEYPILMERYHRVMNQVLWFIHNAGNGSVSMAPWEV